MPTNPHHRDLDPEENTLAQMGYEVEDVEYKSLGRSMVWFFMFVAFCGVAGFAIFALFMSGGSIPGAWEKMTNAPASSAPLVKRSPESPYPLLQTNVTARTDIRDLRREENAILHGKPAYIDQAKGIVRIPIERAIDLYASRMAGSNGKAETTIVSGAPPAGGEPPAVSPASQEAGSH